MYYAGTVLLFLVLAYGFVPEVLTGKVVNQSDITGYRSMSQEAVTWNKAHPDDPTYWSGLDVRRDSDNLVRTFERR